MPEIDHKTAILNYFTNHGGFHCKQLRPAYVFLQRQSATATPAEIDQAIDELEAEGFLEKEWACFLFNDEDRDFTLSPHDVAEARKTGKIIHPESGEEIEFGDFAKNFYYTPIATEKCIELAEYKAANKPPEIAKLFRQITDHEQAIAEAKQQLKNHGYTYYAN